jgi:hypothetical protein
MIHDNNGSGFCQTDGNSFPIPLLEPVTIATCLLRLMFIVYFFGEVGKQILYTIAVINFLNWIVNKKFILTFFSLFGKIIISYLSLRPDLFIHILKMLSRKVERLDSVKPWQPFGNEEGAKFYLQWQKR